VGKRILHPLDSDLVNDQLIVIRVVSEHRHVGPVALVAGTGMGDLPQLDGPAHTVLTSTDGLTLLRERKVE
ncbi:uncharacterized protein METZ01_LOCUS361063, partial [marine metagenome]